MSKYLNLFKTKTESDAAVYDENNTPNVSYCEEDNSVKYTEKIVLPPPLEATFVDLGLPSGLKWAKANLGAESETDPGLYYMWGDTEGHAKDSGYGFTSANYTAKGLDTISTNLSLAQDAVNVRLGGSWRMPTKEDYLELCANCFAEWTKNYDGTGKAGIIFYSTTSNATGKGYYHALNNWKTVIGKNEYYNYNGSKPSGFVAYTLDTPHIFIPMAGCSQDQQDSYGYYWSSSWCSDIFGFTLYLTNGGINPEINGKYIRHLGMPVRGVCTE